MNLPSIRPRAINHSLESAMNRFYRPLLFLFLVLLAAGQGLAAPSAQDDPDRDANVVSSNPLTEKLLNSGPVTYPRETYDGLETLRSGHADQAYAMWVEQGLNGNIQALALAAMLCLAEEREPSAGWQVQFGKDAPPPSPVCPVPAAFWEKSLVDMLGEAEAAFLLGLYGMELMDYDPHRKMETYARPVETYRLRSARAGHPSGMYGAYLTGENRTGPFIPPTSLPNIPILPEKFNPRMTAEGRYWLSQAAHAGHLFSMESLALDYDGGTSAGSRKKPPKSAPDLTKIKYYYNMAIIHGSPTAAAGIGLLYAEGNILPQNCPNSIYYAAIMTRIEEKGSIVLNNKEHYPLGNALLILKEGFMEGNLMLGGKRVVRQPCLTEAEFDDAVARSKTAYEAAMAVRAKEKAAHDALYDKAREKLPRVKAAYEEAVRNGQTGIK